MRISDWSSDVCSSDLENLAGAAVAIDRAPRPRPFDLAEDMGGMQQAPGVRELPVGIAFGPLDRLDLPARLKTPDEGPRLGPREFILDGELTTKAIGDFEPLGIIFRHLRAPAKGSSRSARSDRHLPRGPVRQPEDRAIGRAHV